MSLSAPLYHLKRQAKLLSRAEAIPLHAALDHIAAQEGYASWSLLVAKLADQPSAAKLFARLRPGDLLLIGARPGQGKTLMGLELAVAAIKAGGRSLFFTLEYTHKDVRDRIQAIGVEWAEIEGHFTLDSSDAISAASIVQQLGTARPGTLAVIDYLQLLDQKREHPDLMTQVRQLKTCAQDKGLILVFLSQIDRSYDPSAKTLPDLGDIRLPNPLDLTLFSKTCFLQGGKVQFRTVS
jgi:hypothetical protein